MGAQLDQLPSFNNDSDLAKVVVDSPKGSRNTYKFDPKTNDGSTSAHNCRRDNCGITQFRTL